MATDLALCPCCGAVLVRSNADLHIKWHASTRTLDGWTEAGAVFFVQQHEAPDDEAPTQKLPPITDTVRRRPPVPDVRELRGSELLRALADELDAEGLSAEDLDQ